MTKTLTARSLSLLLVFAFCTPILKTASAQTPETNKASLVIHSDQTGPTINRNIYGHFAEHLGRLIYEGLWVGEDSKIPNTRGLRNDVVAALKELHVPVLRWPGGCFSDEYHWKDGIGPRDKRPRRPNASWGGVDTNAFGTHEFMDLCELLGADAYINGNVGSGTPQEMMEWIEYMTSDSDSTLAQMRRQNGREKPWKVPFFAVGNETWGCGGRCDLSITLMSIAVTQRSLRITQATAFRSWQLDRTTTTTNGPKCSWRKLRGS